MFFRENRGFSLLEIMIVILVISILAAVVTPHFFDFQLRAKRAKAREDIDAINYAISLLEQEEGKSLWDYAREADAAGITVNDTIILGFLVAPYLENLPADPWGYRYVCDPEVNYVLSRGANGVENSNDIPGNQDIKVFFGSRDLAICEAIYLNFPPGGTEGDKVYVYFTQTVAVTGSLPDLAGDFPNDQGNGVDSDPANPTVPSGCADAAWFTTYDKFGGSQQDMVGTDVTAFTDYTESATPFVNNTRLLVMTLAATGVINAVVEDNLKKQGYINLTAAGVAALIGCDLDSNGADVHAVAHTGLGIKIFKP